MKQKIEWYKEVLELDPGSRVFFPLAKLLAASGQSSEAVLILQQGLSRHRDYLEARLFLVELLFAASATHELETEIDSLSATLAMYPGFWEAWSKRLAAAPDSREAALALRFFSAALQGKKAVWSDVIAQGLQSVLYHGEYTGLQEADKRNVNAEPVKTGAGTVFPPHRPSYPAEGIGRKAPAELPSCNFGEGEPEEDFSLRTRSMAEILAGQGDIAGALDIYQELMRSASQEERMPLATRIEELAACLNPAHIGREALSGEEDAPQDSGSVRLIGLLESLAHRLEERARRAFT